MKTFVRETTCMSGIPHGWGNGYVIIPKGHPCYGKDYNDIEVDVHGGLTFAEFAKEVDWLELTKKDESGWIVGFDTGHWGDNILNWPKSAVSAETNRLKRQLEKIK